VAVISADVMLKTIVGHFFGDRDAYMTTKSPDINGYIPDTVMISGSGNSPFRGNFRIKTLNPKSKIQNPKSKIPSQIGSTTRTVVCLLGLLSIVKSPPRSWARRLVMISPNPEPCCS
jgi:hypothetical protein